ncbi:MAG: hypothetical protein QOJ74_793, partial [Ilumatobacteraceae bacterium]|nr:hypothetical protein [Ilumatobacteraceae bacterium]
MAGERERLKSRHGRQRLQLTNDCLTPVADRPIGHMQL